MMELTRKGEYAIRAVIYLARRPQGEVALLGEIAESAQAPATFLAKILQGLAKLGLVRSARGAGGGFVLGRPANEITLREVVEAVEGPIVPNRCLTSGGPCQAGGACRVHHVWRIVQSRVVEVLDGVTVADLAQQEQSGHL
jgi:Rrf2 family protein